jgi:hypothetical protein
MLQFAKLVNGLVYLLPRFAILQSFAEFVHFL